MCAAGGGRTGRGEGKRKGDEEDEDRGNGPLPRVLRLRDITETRSAESGWDGKGRDEQGLVTGEEKGPTFVHVRLKFSVGFQ